MNATTGLSDGDALAVQAGAESKPFRQGTDFVPLNLSGNRKASAALVFVGYGITAPEYKYDDYAGIDVHDKIAIILRHEPQENDEKSLFAGKNLTEHALISSKVVNAKLHGATAVLLVNDLPNHAGSDDELPRFEPLMATENLGILVDQVSVAVVNKLLTPSSTTVL